MKLRSGLIPTKHDPAPLSTDGGVIASTLAAESSQRALRPFEVVIASIALPLWLAVFVVGTLVNSQPFRARFADFQGSAAGVVSDGLVIIVTYTLTNVGLLCILASALGAIGARAGLGPDGDGNQAGDSTAPASSAVLRGFFVYMTVLAGVLVFADRPVEPTQTQYVRLAGLVSLFAFTLNYYPALFAQLLKRAGDLGGKA